MSNSTTRTENINLSSTRIVVLSIWILFPSHDHFKHHSLNINPHMRLSNPHCAETHFAVFSITYAKLDATFALTVKPPISRVSTGWAKKVSLRRLHITSSNTGRFTKFFHCHILQEICNKAMRWGGIFNDHFIANFLQNVTVKEFRKSASIWRSYV